ncbi:MAG: hypothetical protein ACREQ5_00765 [Candidatus Dormibacteria bacterium]
MLTNQHRVFPDVGGFPPGSFDHLLQRRVDMPGLDPGWEHTLIGAVVEPDGSSAVLTIHSEPRQVLSLDRSLRIVSWQPPAHVRAHTPDGEVLCETRLDAPLSPGQLVEMGGVTYRVAAGEPHELWPHRDRVTGVCRDTVDWQHVVLIPDPQPAHHPTLARG